MRHSHLVRTIELSPQQPCDAQLQIRLVRVKPNGTATISVSDGDEIISAKVGKPFLGRYGRVAGYRVRTFGERGLILASSDPRTQSVVLESHSAKWTIEAP